MSDCVIVFVKYPFPGTVKTRLAGRIGRDLAEGLYRSMVQDVLAAVRESGYCLQVHFTPETAHREMTGWLGTGFLLAPQTEGDLGERMANAFARAFSSGAERVLLVGSDIPGLTASVLHEAFSALEQQDAVIGPAHDGGYYLIGFKSSAFSRDVFRNMPWGTGMVYRATLPKLLALTGLVHILPEMIDVDTIDDVKLLVDRVHESSATMQFAALHEEQLFFDAASTKRIPGAEIFLKPHPDDGRMT